MQDLIRHARKARLPAQASRRGPQPPLQRGADQLLCQHLRHRRRGEHLAGVEYIGTHAKHLWITWPLKQARADLWKHPDIDGSQPFSVELTNFSSSMFDMGSEVRGQQQTKLDVWMIVISFSVELINFSSSLLR